MPIQCSALRKPRGSESYLNKGVDIVAAAIVAFTALSSPALAADVPSTSGTIAGKQVPEAVYFGNGCFWGRQYDFINAEKALGRQMPEMSAVVGYAGGRASGPGGKVCYYISDPRAVYERLGHAEVVQVALSGDPSAEPKAVDEFRSFARTYFRQFQRTPLGMIRSDPQDTGPGYRNVVGLPGGVKSPLYPILQEENKNGMELREGFGNGDKNDKQAREDDMINVVWVVDSGQLPFYRAETYHQFHNGLGKFFPLEYTMGMKREMEASGKIGPTGCPELPF